MYPIASAHLVQDKLGDIYSRNGPSVEVREVGERAMRAAARLVVQDCRTHEHPVEAALADDGFLPVLVGIYLSQEKRKNQLVEKKPAVPSAVTGADTRDAD